MPRPAAPGAAHMYGGLARAAVLALRLLRLVAVEYAKMCKIFKSCEFVHEFMRYPTRGLLLHQHHWNDSC